jgi:hypothetical protein
MAVGQQLHFRDRGICSAENTRFIANGFDPPFMGFEMTARAVQIDRIRHAFLQQQARRAEGGTGHESLSHRGVKQHVSQRLKCHP